ncbi:MAG: cell wall hydrolase, partial [Oscillospiraceae bacterium]
MKKLITILPAIALVFALSMSARAAYEPDVDYTALMVKAATVGDYQTGTAAEQARGEKISQLGLDTVNIKFEELMLLSKIIYAEAGSEWLSDEWKMSVGEVVLNRVASPEFPNTIAEVLAQPGQYYGANSRYFNNLIPSERCVNAALRLLKGERLLSSAVVFQANFVQGSGTHKAYYDKHLGWTYF